MVQQIQKAGLNYNGTMCSQAPRNLFFGQKPRNPQIHITANIRQITTTLDQICAVLWAIFLNVTK